jgi:hypothetical protein
MEIIGRVREKYPRASKPYDVTVVPDKNPESEKANATDIVWKKRKRYDDNTGLEGCYVLRTDRTDLTDQEIWKTYVMLTRIEKAFRSLKSSLGLRPNVHQLAKGGRMPICLSRCLPIIFSIPSNTSCDLMGTTAPGIPSGRRFRPTSA